MIELHPPDGMALDTAVAALSGALSLRVHPERGRDRSYYDTFDGLLYEEGLTLLHEPGQLVLVELQSGAARGSVAMRRPSRPLLVADLPAGRLRDELRDVAGVRALLHLARVDCRERAIDVLDDEGKLVVRLTLTAPALLGADHATVPLARRLRLTGLRGYDDELARVREVMCAELGFTTASVSLLDEAVRAAGREPTGVDSKPAVALSEEQPAGPAVAALLRAQLGVIEANLSGAVGDIDTEFLHDLRVAVRRSRAVQRQFKDVFEPGELRRFRAEFKWLQQATGDARDFDVYLLGFDDMRALIAPDMRADLEPLLGVLRDRHRRAHAATRRALRSERTATLLASWRTCLDALGEGRGGPEVDRPVAELAAKRIRKVYRQMIRMGSAIGPDSPGEDYHELRKKGKELRYLLELFGTPLYPADVVKPLVKTLKALQDVLGHHQDREVQAATLRSLTGELARAPHGLDALVAVGALIQRLGEDEQAARRRFGACFGPFASSQRRHLVKKTFR